jgi:hypothetical protein
MVFLAGGSAYAGAFVPNAPAVFLIVPVLLLAWSDSGSLRIAISVAAHAALWSPLPGMAVAYGLSPTEAWVGILALMFAQAIVVGLFPPVAGVSLWAASPFGFGHPLFGVFSVIPFQLLGELAGVCAAVAILAGLAVRQTTAATLVCLTLLGVISVLNADTPSPSVIESVPTAFGERSLFPVEDWAAVGVKLAQRTAPGPVLLPEATIGQDAERAHEFFSRLAQSHDRDLLVGVSGPNGEKIVRFFKDGRIATVHNQVQGVPFINDALAWPWQFFTPPVEVHGERVSFAICYEAFLPTTWVSALISRSTTVAVVSNDRWSASVVKIAQAKLLSFPWPASIVLAANLPENLRND